MVRIMKQATPPAVTVGSLFSGIGGMDRGLEQAGWDVVWGCEANEQAANVFRAHWPNVPVYPDVRDLSANRLIEDGHPFPDVIAGGSPCQDLSSAGRRAGLMRGERSNLFFDYVRLVQECRPQAFVWENVPGLFSLNDGDDFRVAIDTFARAGYALDLDVLDSRFFGVAQRRRRIFAVGVRPDVLLSSPSGAGYAAQVMSEIAVAAVAEHRPNWVSGLPAWASGEGAARRFALFADHGGLAGLAKLLSEVDPEFAWSEYADVLGTSVSSVAARGSVLLAAAEFEKSWLLSAAAWRESVVAGSWAAEAGLPSPLVALSAEIADALAGYDGTDDCAPTEVADLVDRAVAGADGWTVPDPGEDLVAACAEVAFRAERIAGSLSGPGRVQAELRSGAAAGAFRSYVDEAFASLFGPLEFRDRWDAALDSVNDDEQVGVSHVA